MNINNELVKDWLDKLDGESEVGLLTSIVNSEISIPEMIDSIYAHHLGETESAKDFYKRMWRK
tara:strand:- start:80 stop:268 length:189 start_codon:yes stop_codon:yes gene_type:complete